MILYKKTQFCDLKVRNICVCLVRLYNTLFRKFRSEFRGVCKRFWLNNGCFTWNKQRNTFFASAEGVFSLCRSKCAVFHVKQLKAYHILHRVKIVFHVKHTWEQKEIRRKSTLSTAKVVFDADFVEKICCSNPKNLCFTWNKRCFVCCRPMNIGVWLLFSLE